MHQFAWRDATRNDRPLLQSFSCTATSRRDRSGRRLAHPRPWEREVEAWIRSQTPPAGPNESLRLEELGPYLRAVGALALAERREGIVIVKLRAVAINIAHRGGDGTVADGVIEDVLRTATELAAAAGGTRTILVAWVDHRNLPSKRLLGRSGFALRRALPHNLEEWVVEVLT